MAEITIEKETATSSGWKFVVKVISVDSTTEHAVTISKEDWQSLTEELITPQELVVKSFEFLLARESNESILRTFDVTVISKYFPDFPAEIKKALNS